MNLKIAIMSAKKENQTMKEFARSLDITPEHLSRIINHKCRASKQILKKISENCPNPPEFYFKLLIMSGYLPCEKENPMDIGQEIATLAINEIEKIKPIGICLPDEKLRYLQVFVDGIAEKLNEQSSLRGQKIKTVLSEYGNVKNYLSNAPQYENYIVGRFLTVTELESNYPCQKITVPFVIFGHISRNNIFYIEKITMEGKYVKNFISPATEDILYQDGKDIDTEPFIVEISDERQRIKELMEEYIFSGIKTALQTVEGVGFYLDQFPPKLFEFIKNHLDDTQDADDEIFRKKIFELAENPQKYSKEEIKILLAEEDSENSCDGWQGMVANIIKQNSGMPVTYWDEDTDVPAEYRTKDVIMITEEHLKNQEDKQKAIETMNKYAKELGLEKTGWVYSQFTAGIKEKYFDIKD